MSKLSKSDKVCDILNENIAASVNASDTVGKRKVPEQFHL